MPAELGLIIVLILWLLGIISSILFIIFYLKNKHKRRDLKIMELRKEIEELKQEINKK